MVGVVEHSAKLSLILALSKSHWMQRSVARLLWRVRKERKKGKEKRKKEEKIL